MPLQQDEHAMRSVTASQQNLYPWGDGCSGWKLLELEHMQVGQETMPTGERGAALEGTR